MLVHNDPMKVTFEGHWLELQTENEVGKTTYGTTEKSKHELYSSIYVTTSQKFADRYRLC